MASCQESSDCDCGFKTLPYLRKHKPKSELLHFVVHLRKKTATPEMVFNFLSSPSYPATAYDCRDTEPAIIFLECMQFIMTKSPEACIDGIWENIFKKTMSYSTKLSSTMFYWNKDRVYMYMYNWLDEALSSSSKCPNPYVRLEIFRMYRLVGYINGRNKTWEKITDTFMVTICEIKAHRLYSIDEENDVLFEPGDFGETIVQCCRTWKLQKIIATALSDFKSVDDFMISSNIPMFLGHCIQIIGVLSIIAWSNTDHGYSNAKIDYLTNDLFKKYFIPCFFKKCEDYIEDPSAEMIFRHIVANYPVSCYAIEVVRDITDVVTKSREFKATKHMLALRDMIIQDIEPDVVYELPRLVMSRQVEGPAPFHRQALGLKGFSERLQYHIKDPPRT